MKLLVKSIPEIWEKEKDGRKPNTVRNPLNYGDTIEVENTETGKRFERTITDVTRHNGKDIISWEHKEKKKC